MESRPLTLPLYSSPILETPPEHCFFACRYLATINFDLDRLEDTRHAALIPVAHPVFSAGFPAHRAAVVRSARPHSLAGSHDFLFSLARSSECRSPPG